MNGKIIMLHFSILKSKIKIKELLFKNKFSNSQLTKSKIRATTR
jgi:hypothetical protein